MRTNRARQGVLDIVQGEHGVRKFACLIYRCGLYPVDVKKTHPNRLVLIVLINGEIEDVAKDSEWGVFPTQTMKTITRSILMIEK